MRFLDARRLTGPNLLARTPLVVADFELGPAEAEAPVREAYLGELGRMRAALGLAPEVALLSRPHHGGVSFGYPGPLDQLLVGAEASEWAGQSAARRLLGQAPLALQPRASELGTRLAADRSPGLLALEAEARRRGLPFLWDDEQVTVGAGARAFSCRRAAVPGPEAVPWERLGSVPLVLITGTNGKTTSARLLARAAAEAGRQVGLASTGEVTAAGTVLARGDWTGPGAARLVLRHPRVDYAVLETARGGLLRRGLALERADAALITNVSDDHLGLAGVDDVEAMAAVKALVARAVPAGGTVVLNARDPRLVALAPRLEAEVAWFCDLDAAEPPARALVDAHRARGGAAALAEGGQVLAVRGAVATPLAAVADLPLTLGGLARYNVENALGVVALARATGLPDAAVVRALTTFGAEDNPGRGALVERAGVKVFLDFGHNPGALRAVLPTLAEVRRRSGGRLTVVTGCAGDRTDGEIAGMARAIVQARPDRVLVRELARHLRGRRPGEVPALFEALLRAEGLPEGRFERVASEVAALEQACGRGRPGDVVAVLVHLDHQEVQAYLEGLG